MPNAECQNCQRKQDAAHSGSFGHSALSIWHCWLSLQAVCLNDNGLLSDHLAIDSQLDQVGPGRQRGTAEAAAASTSAAPASTPLRALRRSGGQAGSALRACARRGAASCRRSARTILTTGALLPGGGRCGGWILRRGLHRRGG